MNTDSPTIHNTLFVGHWAGAPIPLPFAELLEHHAAVRDAIATSMHTEHNLAPDLATLVGIHSFVYAFNAYKALGLLLPELYHESGAVLLRQLWEVSLNLNWIERDPPVRAQDFCNFTVMEYRKLIQKSGDASPLQAFDDATNQFQAKFRYRDKKGRNQKHSSFATKNIHDRAIELGDPWKKEHDLVYHLASLHAHGAPGAILHSFFQQHYAAPEVRERNSASLVAILSIEVLVRDVQMLVRMGIIPNADEVNKAFALFQNTMERVKAGK
jgi:hypothetical protein